MKNPIVFSIIIVNWNAVKLLRDCLASVKPYADNNNSEIIVIDNNSSDDSCEMIEKDHSDVRLIKNHENAGFAKANNQGIFQSRGDYLFLINSDIIVKENVFIKMINRMNDDPSIGLMGPKVYGKNGDIQRSCMYLPNLWNIFCYSFGISALFVKSKILGGYEMNWFNYDRESLVEVVNGCFWCVKSSFVKEIGGLDEQFFMYAEDIDLCKRFKDFGKKVFFYPGTSVIHLGGGSSKKAPVKYYIEMLKANLQYWRKYRSKMAVFIYRVLILHKELLRLTIRICQRHIMAKDISIKMKIERHYKSLIYLLSN